MGMQEGATGPPREWHTKGARALVVLRAVWVPHPHSLTAPPLPGGGVPGRGAVKGVFPESVRSEGAEGSKAVEEDQTAGALWGCLPPPHAAQAP